MKAASKSRGVAKILVRRALCFCACNLLAAALAAQCTNPTQVPNGTYTSGDHSATDNNALSASNFVISGSATATLVAGNCIQLLPGFRATAGTTGTTFHAWVETAPAAVSVLPPSSSGLSQAFTWANRGRTRRFHVFVRVSAPPARCIVSMPRSKRLVALGVPHHVTQRGNGRQDVFLSDGLRPVYLDLLAEHAGQNRLRVLAYCLMTNHVHLVVVPELECSLANTFRHAHSRFSQYWNTGFHRTGHLWQNRFYSCPVEETAAWRVIRYVEQNPVRAGMVEMAAAYGWSSARAHVGLEASPVLDGDWWKQRWTAEMWAAVLAEGDEEATAIRVATYSGRQYGSGAFVRGLVTELGRRLERGKGAAQRRSQWKRLRWCY